MTVQRPKLHGTTERFAAQLFGTGVTRTNALEALVIAGFVRGLSTRDIEATLVDALGRQASVARSRVSRICEEIKMQVEAWSLTSPARRRQAGPATPARCGGGV